MDNKEKRNELARKKGVPFLETCFEFETPLSFEKSVWVWYQDANTEWELRLRESLHAIPFEAFTVPAPQMHEIAGVLPEKIKGVFGHCGYHFEQLKSTVGYFSNDNDCNFLFSAEIQNHHFAQAYATLYLKLREAGLLEKEVKNV